VRLTGRRPMLGDEVIFFSLIKEKKFLCFSSVLMMCFRGRLVSSIPFQFVLFVV